MFSRTFSFAVGTAIALLSLGGPSAAQVGPQSQDGTYYYIQNIANNQYVKSVGVLTPLALVTSPDSDSVWYVSSVGSDETVFRSARGWHAYSNGNSSIPITDDPNEASHWFVQDITAPTTTIIGPGDSSLFWAAHSDSDKVWVDPLNHSTNQLWKFTPINRSTNQGGGY